MKRERVYLLEYYASTGSWLVSMSRGLFYCLDVARAACHDHAALTGATYRVRGATLDARPSLVVKGEG